VVPRSLRDARDDCCAEYVLHDGSEGQQHSNVIDSSQLVVQYDAEDSQTGHALNVRPLWRQRHPSRRENDFLRLASILT